MTGLQFTAVLGIIIASWLAMYWTMRTLRPSILGVALVLLCFAGIAAAFRLGMYWNHE